MQLTALLLASCMMAAAQPGVESAGVRIGGTAWPRAAMDSRGGTVRLAGPAMRIVSLSGAAEEYLYQIVPPERIVGVSKSAYNPDFSAVLDKVNKYHPALVQDFDTAMSLKPDLVITADEMAVDNAGERLRDAGVPVFAIMITPTVLDQVAGNIMALGYVTGADEGAAAELRRFEGEVSRIAAQCRAPHGQPRIYGVSMTGFSYGDHTLFQDVMRLVGGTNVAAQGGLHTYQRVDAPTIASWKPDWVFTWAVPGKGDQELHRWMEDPDLSRTPASQNHHVIVLKSMEVLPLSSLITGFMSEIAKATCPKE